MSKSHESTRVVVVALIINLIIALFKTLCAALTGSSAMFSESVHSFVDCGNQILMLLGVRESKREADQSHPLGFHRSIYIYAFLVPTMIFIGGASTSIYEGINKIRHPEPYDNIVIHGHSYPGWILSLFVLFVSMGLEGFGLRNAWNAFRKTHSDGIFDAMKKTRDTSILISILEDGGAVCGLIVTTFFTVMTIVTGNGIWDGIGAVFVGLMLLNICYFLAKETKSLAIGEGNPEIEKYIRSLIPNISQISRMNSCIALHHGPEYVIVLASIDWVDYVTAGEVEKISHDIDVMVKSKWPSVKRIYLDIRSSKA